MTGRESSNALAEFLSARLEEEERRRYDVHENWCGRCTCGWPLRIFREVAAMRTIMNEHRESDIGLWCNRCDPGSDMDSSITQHPCRTLRALAAIYSDHPDYRESWKP